MSGQRNANYYEKSVPTTDTVMLGADPHRKSLYLENPTSIAVNVRIDGQAATTSSMYLTNSVPPKYLDWEMFGRGIQREIHAIAASGGANLVIIEGYD